MELADDLKTKNIVDIESNSPLKFSPDQKQAIIAESEKKVVEA